MAENENSKIKLYERVAKLEINMETVSSQIQDIITNHLPHLDQRVMELEKRVTYYLGALAAIQFVIGVALAIYLRR
jgi:hypothetical protein